MSAMPDEPADLLIPPTLQRRIRTLGHGLYRFAEAWKLLATRLDRGLLSETTTAWVKHWCGEDLSKPLPLPVDSALVTEIVWVGKNWQVAGVAAGKEAGGMADPWAAALLLLHLPVLRGFWMRALRVQRFRWLSQALPRVWALDMQELRPGAVIAGVGAASWQDLPRVMATGRKFEMLPEGGGEAQPVETAAWPGVLAELNGRRLRLREKVAHSEGQLTATWKRDETGRIVLDGFSAN
jgi:hypothetical protein